jgi:hypothetical protein
MVTSRLTVVASTVPLATSNYTALSPNGTWKPSTVVLEPETNPQGHFIGAHPR